jgi:hypothetical protein
MHTLRLYREVLHLLLVPLCRFRLVETYRPWPPFTDLVASTVACRFPQCSAGHPQLLVNLFSLLLSTLLPRR